MNKIEESIKTFDLLFSDNIEESLNNNCSSSISLLKLVNSFNKMYQSFKKEFQKIKTIDLGEEIFIEKFSNFVDMRGNKHRDLYLAIINPSIVDRDYTFLCMSEQNGVMSSFITNDINSYPCDNHYYRKDFLLNHDLIKEYLDLFEKYDLLFELYNILKDRIIYNDGTNVLVTKITSDNILDKIKSFKISIGSHLLHSKNNYFNFSINLDNEISYDYDESRVVIEGENIALSSNLCNEILNNVHLNGRYLANDIDDNKSNSAENKIKKIINNDK